MHGCMSFIRPHVASARWKAMVSRWLSAGVLARGDAAINMRFPKPGYREKIWDHAAGALIVQEAGAVISDASGARLTK